MFEGVKVLELGTWVMVPAAATVLADFGAEVIKVEHPRLGDPGRAMQGAGVGDINVSIEQVNRGKRSVGLDLSRPEAAEVLYALAARSDVFMTSFLPRARRRLGFEVEDLRAHNPNLIYVRGSSTGTRGDEVDKPGFDFTVFWARSGFQSAVTNGSGVGRPVGPRPGFGDKTSAMNIAFGVAAALFHRERTGEPSVVDVSLLSSGLWSNSSDVAYSLSAGRDFSAAPSPRQPPNGSWATADGRFVFFNFHDATRWPDLCEALGRPELATDPRFADAAARRENAPACTAELEAAFGAATLDEWRVRLAPLNVAWEVVQTPFEVADDPQVVANGYLAEVAHPGDRTVRMVRPPVQFDGRWPDLGRAPGIGQHTDEVLAELGLADRIGAWRADGVI